MVVLGKTRLSPATSEVFGAPETPDSGKRVNSGVPARGYPPPPPYHVVGTSRASVCNPRNAKTDPLCSWIIACRRLTRQTHLRGGNRTISPGQYPPGQYPQGQYPPPLSLRTISPQDNIPPGQYPPGQYPPGPGCC